MDERKEFDIRFEYTDEWGNHYEARTMADSLYDGDILVDLGRCFNNFLRQLTYVRDKDLIFMEAIDEEEYDMLVAALDDYRNGRENDNV